MVTKIEEIYRDIDTLPEEAQSLLLDFIQLLKKRYPQTELENHTSLPPLPTIKSLSELDPWTQSLIGVIRLESQNPEESYVNYLEEKYS
ncbi:hypothetical protein [Nodularia spumigena]|uniref:hypothetical protein n=2 Tax=Nodularia spumigena TaxID=70799 RepID=UPI00232C8A39|nr:hypothetical protein [Nodularia spumigena]MDB9318615.1 hypothetical protein [Nodularia spumigena CS-590/01A]MDB9327760.1 hypothetical protein [Nodularia spumigena CS-590/02]